MSSTPQFVVKSIQELLVQGEASPASMWKVSAILHDECMTYIAWNQDTCEALMVDPKFEIKEECLRIASTLKDYIWVAVIDTHTHADHVSAAADLAAQLGAPLVMHSTSGTTRVDLRVCKSTVMRTHAGALELIPTPGHTPDGITAVWGPLAFTGDTVFFADVGRDDLPGGNAEAHFDSLEVLKTKLRPETIVLPGHDFKGGRASSWATQLKINSSLTQSRADYVTESNAFQAPAPKDFKRSLVENLK